MKILITGANGFIGRNLTEFCLNKGNEVYGLSIHNNNLIGLLPKMSFTSCNMEDIYSINKSMSFFEPEVVVHCAWWGGNNFRQTEYTDQFNENIPPLVKFMAMLNNSSVKHFVGIGSGAEYGMSPSPVKEDVSSPNDLYGATKGMAKLYTEQICKIEKIDWSWIRPIYTYGPYDVKTRLIPKTIISCLRNQNLELNDCESLMDYLFIDDFVKSLYTIIETRYTGVTNICSASPIKIRSIIEKIQSMTGTSSSITFNASLNRSNVPTVLYGDNSRLKILVNPVETVTIDNGLQKTINFYRSHE